jgi:hypothetical protein
MIDFCLLNSTAIVIFMVAFAATQNGKWQIAKFSLFLVAWISLKQQASWSCLKILGRLYVIYQKNESMNNDQNRAI